MRKRKLTKPLLVAASLLLVIGIPVRLTLQAVQRSLATRNLIAAITAQNTPDALAALNAGADPNTRCDIFDEQVSFSALVKSWLDKLLHPKRRWEMESLPTAMHLALERNAGDDPTLVKALLDFGANPNLTCDYESYRGLLPESHKHVSSLMLAAERKLPRNFGVLLSKGANVQSQDDNGNTPLHWAAKYGTPEIVETLLQKGASIDAKNHDGGTPLLDSISCNDDAVVNALLSHHPDPNIRCHGKTALDYVLPFVNDCCTTDSLTSHNSIIVQTLRKAGAKTASELDAEARLHINKNRARSPLSR